MGTRLSRREFLRFSSMLGAGFVGWIASGCSAPTPAPPAATIAPTVPAAPTTAPSVPAVLKGASGEIIWYATAPQATLDAVSKKFNETHPGMKMSGQFNSAPLLAQKAEAEITSGKPLASIMMQPSPIIFYGWREKGYLLEYASPEEKAYPKWFVEPGWWIGARTLDIQLTFNTKLVPQKPTSWEVLTDPKYKDKLAFPDAGTLGGPPLLWYKMLKEKYGPDFWPKVAANQPKIVQQTGQALDLCVNGEVAFGEMYGYDITTALKQNPSAPVQGAWLAPTPLTYAANALLKSSPNLDGAKVAYDWLASKEGQQAIVDANNCLSARSDITYPPGRAKMGDLTWAEYDIREFAKNEEALKAEWKKVYGRS